MIFRQFRSQNERSAKIGSDCIELQYCRKKRGTPVSRIVDVNAIKNRDNTSLYFSDDDSEKFYAEYSEIFCGGIYSNGESGPVDFYGINWYSPEQVKLVCAKLKERASEDDRVLLDWLEKARKYNGIYILGV